MTERRSQQDRAARVVPELDWRTHADVLVDIYFDGVNHAPDERCYVDGALGAAMERTRIALAAVPPMLNRLTEAETTASASEHESIGTQIAKAEFAKRWDEAAQRKCDESVTPEFLRWLQDEAYREGVAANVAWNAGVAWARASASEPACKTCGGKRYVPDGVLTGEGGVEYDEPIACTKDCPDCAAPLAEAPKAVAWGYAKTVGNAIAQLQTMDPALPIYGAMHLDDGRCIARGLTFSRERVVGERWIDSANNDVPYSIVAWSHTKDPADRAAPLPTQEALERDALVKARAHIVWQSFGECRSPDWEAAPPSAREAVDAIDAALQHTKGQR